MKARRAYAPHPCKKRPAPRIVVYVCPTARAVREVISPFCMGSAFALAGYSVCPISIQNPGAKPFELFALLLLTVPSVFTFTKLVELLAFGERSHQLTAIRDIT